MFVAGEKIEKNGLSNRQQRIYGHFADSSAAWFPTNFIN
jgi:hypothetical protein